MTDRRHSLSRIRPERDAEAMKIRRKSSRPIASLRPRLAGRHSEPTVNLQPKRPPGRADRKAAAYAVEIVRLRSDGYTFEAIREAMADVGIELSTSALRREVRRLRGRSNAVLSASPSKPRPTAVNALSTQSPGSSSPATSPLSSPDSRGHALAEAFFTAHPSNPLVRTQEVP